MITAVTLNAAADMTYVLSELKPGGSNRVKQVYKEPGGKGVNAAKVLHSLRIPVTAAGFAGGGSGAFITETLKKRRMRTAFTPIADESRCCHSILETGSGKAVQTELLEKGPQISAEEWQRFIKIDFPRFAEGSRYIICSGSLPQGLSDDTYAQCIEAAAGYGAEILLDTGGKPLKAALRARPFLIKPNLSELEELLGRRCSTFPEVAEGLKEIAEEGAGMIAVTLGDKGSILYTGKELLYASAPVTETVNPTGCGDAFLAGFAAALYNGAGMEAALRSAAACGAANALEWTAGTINLTVYEQLIERVIVQRMEEYDGKLYVE